MLIPDYWAETTLKQKFSGKQFTVKRFGWSEQSQQDAQRNADARAEDALARLIAGEKLERSEPKVAYNGANGLPIREQVLSRHDDAVVTRNIYGARCLNSPNVLFADIDFVNAPMPGFVAKVVGLAMLAGILIGKNIGGWWLAIGFMFAALFIGFGLANLIFKSRQRIKGTPLQQARRRIDGFLMKHPAWRLRLYQTPAGMRLLAMHRTFDPAETEVAAFFREIEADKIYVRMCMNQNCFRARVSPKPWRIGITDHLKPRPGVWPINPLRMPDRQQWVDEYELASEGFSSCHYITDLGSDNIDPTVEKVRALHDDMCRAESQLPFA